jgi:DNA-binding helix-hairpin-helix protein with protein kinase domain
MRTLLRIGQTVQLRFSGLPCTISEFIAGGGQGQVYKATLPSGAVIAVKWYSPEYVKEKDPRVEDRLTALINLDFPFEAFIWPFDLADAPGVPAFGYGMPLCPDNFRSVESLINDADQPSFRALAIAAFNIATAFNDLHSDSEMGGRCYRDVSATNVRVDPATSAVRILDNDNVDITGTPGPMRGSLGYQAPEVVLGKSFPNVYTDLHSLAVILFRLLLVDHPLDGERENSAMGDFVKLYGLEPVFIFDPNDASNRPIPGIHKTAPLFWEALPKFIRDLFEQAFTVGLHRPHRRVVDGQWREGLARLLDSIFECSCGAENFYDWVSLQSPRGLGACWNCKQALSSPPRMLLDGNFDNVVMLTPQTQLFSHHILKTPYNFSQPLARVVGTGDALENLSQHRWFVKNADGSSEEVRPGQIAPLVSRARIHFGRVTAEVKK